MAKYSPKNAINWCICVIIVLVFIAALFAAGMAIYAGFAGISYAQAWTNLIEAGRTVTSK